MSDRIEEHIWYDHNHSIIMIINIVLCSPRSRHVTQSNGMQIVSRIGWHWRMIVWWTGTLRQESICFVVDTFNAIGMCRHFHLPIKWQLQKFLNIFRLWSYLKMALLWWLWCQMEQTKARSVRPVFSYRSDV